MGALANRAALWLLGLVAVIPPTHFAVPVPDPTRLWIYVAIVWGLVASWWYEFTRVHAAAVPTLRVD